MNRYPQYILIVFVALVGFGVAYFWGRGGIGDPPEVLALAQCLSDKGITMYGADWCPHCQNEKRAFGNAFALIPYVECPAEPQRCVAAGVNGYPTWIFPDGKKLEGEQGLKGLAEESGCEFNGSK